MRYLSPLRYPGGKARLAPFIGALVRAQDPVPTRYSEPYAGGAGAALRLLADGVVSHVHINDANPGLAAFWRTVTDPDRAEEAMPRARFQAAWLIRPRITPLQVKENWQPVRRAAP